MLTLKSCCSFEEFKDLYNAAVDDAAGARKKSTVAKAALPQSTLAAREAIKVEKAKKKAEEAEK